MVKMFHTSRVLLVEAGGLDSVDITERAAFNELLGSTVGTII